MNVRRFIPILRPVFLVDTKRREPTAFASLRKLDTLTCLRLSGSISGISFAMSKLVPDEEGAGVTVPAELLNGTRLAGSALGATMPIGEITKPDAYPTNSGLSGRS
jgi:hypothetical protein